MAEFHPEAREELLRAVDWYDDRRLGLGGDFAQRVQEQVRLIEAFPHIGALVPLPQRRGAVRRLRVARFPYAIVYVIRDETIFILAVAHGSRRPDYWRSR